MSRNNWDIGPDMKRSKMFRDSLLSRRSDETTNVESPDENLMSSGI
jgi:hypothetical protein